MSEATASTNMETASGSSDSGTGSSVEAGESEAPSAANDNTPRASNDDMAVNTLSGGDGAQKGQSEAGMSGPAKAADWAGARPAANDDTPQAASTNATHEAGEGKPPERADDTVLGSDASQAITADNSGSGRRIGEMKNGELSPGFDKSAGKKGGGGKGGSGSGDGEDGSGDKNKGTERPELTQDATGKEAPVGTDVVPNATRATEAGTGESATGQEASAARTKAHSKPNGPRGARL